MSYRCRARVTGRLYEIHGGKKRTELRKGDVGWVRKSCSAATARSYLVKGISSLPPPFLTINLSVSHHII